MTSWKGRKCRTSGMSIRVVPMISQSGRPTCITSRHCCSGERLLAQHDNCLMPQKPEQLCAAQEAYSRLGATYRTFPELHSNEVIHEFRIAEASADEDLKKLPDLPFPFGLSLALTRVTDAGLPNLKRLAHLAALTLNLTKVTDEGVKHLRDLPQLTFLHLGQKATDAGLKNLPPLPN